MTSKNSATARAHSNIALAKYWGKADVKLNLPAVPSLSMTLDKFFTETTVSFDSKLKADRLLLNDKPASKPELARASRALDTVRQLTGVELRAQVNSKNNFPTAAGLASSASGFAALVAAGCTASGKSVSATAMSRLARQASASAARSIFGGFVELGEGKPGQATLAAREIAPEEHWDVRLVVAITAEGKKSVGSTEGMERSRKTSPVYEAWIENAPKLFKQVKRGVLERDLHVVGRAMEQSTYAFHACAQSAWPSVRYWNPTTLEVLATVDRLRAKGIGAYATMDAGPHVKVLCEADDAARVRRALRSTDGVLSTLTTRPGPGVRTWGR